MRAHLAMQNVLFTDADISPYGVVNDVVSVNGSAFLAANHVELDGNPENTSEEEEEAELEEFLGATEEEIEEKLNNYLGNHLDIYAFKQGIIILDIEDPVHLNGLHSHSESEQLEIIEGFKKRIRVTRRVFPQAKLGLYGALVPEGRGIATDSTYMAREAALIKAGRHGLYDGLDYLVPVLYNRFGCNAGGLCDNSGWGTVGAYTQLGITGSRKLLKSDGTSTPLLPLLNFSINNGNSNFHRKLLMDLGVPDPLGQTLRWQLNVLATNGVEDVAFWAGGNNSNIIQLKDSPNPNRRTITGYLHNLFGNIHYKHRIYSYGSV